MTAPSLLHKPGVKSICFSAAEAETGSLKCFCPGVYLCVCVCCMYAEEKKERDAEIEGWSSLQQVEIPFSLPLLFVSTAGLSQG